MLGVTPVLKCWAPLYNITAILGLSTKLLSSSNLKLLIKEWIVWSSNWIVCSSNWIVCSSIWIVCSSMLEQQKSTQLLIVIISNL